MIRFRPSCSGPGPGTPPASSPDAVSPSPTSSRTLVWRSSRQSPGLPRSPSSLATHTPSVVLAAGSDRGNEVMAHLGARTELPLAANVTDVVPGEPFRLTRQRWAGSLLEDAVLDAPTKLLTVAPHAVAIEEPASGGSAPAVESFAPTLTDDDLRVAVARRLEPDRSGISLDRRPGRRRWRTWRRQPRGVQRARGARRAARERRSACRGS